MKRLSIVSILFIAACGKGGTPASDKGGDPAAQPAMLPGSAVADANAAIPADLKGKLEFIAGSFAEKDIKLLVPMPKGWEMSTVIPGSYKAPSELGFLTKFSVGSSCDGVCEKKDWAAAADHELFAQFKSGFTLESDSKADGMRTLRATNDGAAYVAVAKWKPDASRYFSCYVVLDREAAAAAPAFEKACRALTPEW